LQSHTLLPLLLHLPYSWPQARLVLLLHLVLSLLLLLLLLLGGCLSS
jgi:hypothetical protein